MRLLSVAALQEQEGIDEVRLIFYYIIFGVNRRGRVENNRKDNYIF